MTYVGHDGEGTVYMTMGGGCHGCSMSRMTMLDGVQTMLSEAVPEVTVGERPHRPHHRRKPVLQLISSRRRRSGSSSCRSLQLLIDLGSTGQADRSAAKPLRELERTRC